MSSSTKYKITDLAYIRSGIHSNLKDKNGIPLKYIQIKDFDTNLNLNLKKSKTRNFKPSISKDALIDDDILIVSRGERFFTYLFKTNEHPAVASSSFFFLMLKVNNLLPDYITAFLNTNHVKEYIKKNSTGGTIKAVKKEAISQLEIEVPPLNKQREIVSLLNTLERYKKLNDKITNLKNELKETSVKKSINKILNGK
jgi:restriction endonuclease S subunit